MISIAHKPAPTELFWYEYAPTVHTSEFLEINIGETTLRKSTSEPDIKTTSQTTTVTNAKALSKN